MTEVAEKPKATEQAKPAEKRVVILNPQRMALREQLRQDWVVHAEAGTTIADVLEPQFWSHMAAQMQPYDRIEVLLETGEWILELVALGVGRNWAQVHVLQKYDLEQRSETAPVAARHRVEWKAGKKHCVIRIADGALVQDGFPSKEEAQVWLANHERVTG